MLLSSSFVLFHISTEIYGRFCSVETSAIDLKLKRQCAEWSQFAFQKFFFRKSDLQSKIRKLRYSSRILSSLRDIKPSRSICDGKSLSLRVPQHTAARQSAAYLAAVNGQHTVYNRVSFRKKLYNKFVYLWRITNNTKLAVVGHGNLVEGKISALLRESSGSTSVTGRRSDASDASVTQSE